MRVLDKISDVVNMLVENLVAILMGVMTVVVFVQVVSRLTSGSLPWSEELARYMMIYMVYVGASVGVKKKSHIAVEFIVGLLPETGRKFAEILADILMLVCFAVIIKFGFNIVQITMMQKTPALHVKMGYIYFSLVLGGLIMCLQNVVNMIKTIVSIVTGTSEEEKSESIYESLAETKTGEKEGNE